MEPSSRRTVVLVGSVAVLLAILGYQYLSGGSGGTAATPALSARGARGGESEPPAESLVPSLRLGELQTARAEPAGPDRNLFRMQPRTAAPPPDSMPQSEAEDSEPAPFAPPPPPPATASLPPIALKFIGIVEGEDEVGRLAVLSDGRFVYHGRVGEVIEGRYRIMRIGDESIEMEYVDGRGRQTIRLSGS